MTFRRHWTSMLFHLYNWYSFKIWLWNSVWAHKNCNRAWDWCKCKNFLHIYVAILDIEFVLEVSWSCYDSNLACSSKIFAVLLASMFVFYLKIASFLLNYRFWSFRICGQLFTVTRYTYRWQLFVSRRNPLAKWSRHGQLFVVVPCIWLFSFVNDNDGEFLTFAFICLFVAASV